MEWYLRNSEDKAQDSAPVHPPGKHAGTPTCAAATIMMFGLPFPERLPYVLPLLMFNMSSEWLGQYHARATAFV